jgi:hypothetical protein
MIKTCAIVAENHAIVAEFSWGVWQEKSRKKNGH